MTMAIADPIFHDQSKAHEWLDAARGLDGVNCPHRGGLHPMAARKKGFSAHEPHRFIGVTCETAWFLPLSVHLVNDALPTLRSGRLFLGGCFWATASGRLDVRVRGSDNLFGYRTVKDHAPLKQ
jgi:hypothetical protein